ncbi:hypothetical protein SEA_GOCRAZY_58 [Arthrobacter phage GoCrazy]|uniref:Uncharacterized protein n=1 Tax=Arthrobacter phage KeaneyLin TaxID=2250412 RepID=A0A345KME4_9CAUD|nr:hypothetical protein PQB83_gp58 [Arthrobacter phage KeaneyLin]AXH44196.1 hypothetical protein SEA_KEANEYLIN_58 [Arthrobacter phage KeaneyLin]QXO13557.1 hypothetical protein SEA_GOCRAZY_58 [Arthrobacter phage GoCrazy]
MTSVQIRVATAFTVGAVAGGATAYYFTKKKYRAIADQEVADVKAYAQEREEEAYMAANDPELYKEWKASQEVVEEHPEDRPLTREELDEKLNGLYDQKLENLGYAEHADLESEGLPTQHDLLTDAERAEAEAAEAALDDDPATWDRDFEKPYVINVNEWNLEHMDNPEWDKVSLKYYDGDTDDVLVPEDGQPITDEEYVVGLANLAHIGVGSEDPNIVYIRNEAMTTDFEITRIDGSYTKLVLGIDEWDDNENRKVKVRKMRGDGN